MINQFDKKTARGKRHRRVRKAISGTADRPRLVVFKSNKHIYAQMIDDIKGATIVAASTLEPDIKKKAPSMKEGAEQVGSAIAERAGKKGIKSAVFDRGGFLYHGNVKAMAEAARKKGLAI